MNGSAFSYVFVRSLREKEGGVCYVTSEYI